MQRIFSEFDIDNSVKTWFVYTKKSAVCLHCILSTCLKLFKYTVWDFLRICISIMVDTRQTWVWKEGFNVWFFQI